MKKAVQAMAKAIEWIGGWAVLLMTVVVLLQVIMRYVFSAPLTWTEELARYLFIYITFLGAALLVYERSHLYVEIIFNNLPHKAKKVMQLVIDAIVLGFSGYLIPSAVSSMKVATGSYSTAIHIPMQYIGLSVLLGAALMLFFSAWNIAQDFKALCGKEEEDKTC